jgi:hypothetical protein
MCALFRNHFLLVVIYLPMESYWLQEDMSMTKKKVFCIYIYIGFISWDVLQSLFLSGDQKCLVNKDYNQTHECTSKTYIYTYILHYTCQNLKIMLNINAWLITITHSKTFPQWTSERRRKNKESKCCVLYIKIHSTQCKCSLSSFASCQREKEQSVCVYISIVCHLFFY